MRAIMQRVSWASVTIDGEIKSSIGNGFMVLLGIEPADSEEDITWLSQKICNMRLFNDEQGVMNLSLIDVKGELLLVSQFTLHASTKKGNRPGYSAAAGPEIAIPLYEKMIAQLQNDLGKTIGTGIFGTDMKVALVNDGTVTIINDTKQKA